MASFPHSLWGLVQSAENLTPRGLADAFSTNEESEFLQNHQLDSFLLSKRRDEGEATEESKEPKSQFKYMIFVWNGKQAGAMVKATAISKGYELDGLLSKAKDSVLQVFFAGGVIRGKKLQRSNVLMFDDMQEHQKHEGRGLEKVRDNPNTPSAEQILKAHQTVYLFKWLFPESVIEKHLKKTNRGPKPPQQQPFSTFRNTFIKSEAK